MASTVEPYPCPQDGPLLGIIMFMVWVYIWGTILVSLFFSVPSKYQEFTEKKKQSQNESCFVQLHAAPWRKNPYHMPLFLSVYNKYNLIYVTLPFWLSFFLSVGSSYLQYFIMQNNKYLLPCLVWHDHKCLSEQNHTRDQDEWPSYAALLHKHRVPYWSQGLLYCSPFCSQMWRYSQDLHGEDTGTETSSPLMQGLGSDLSGTSS